MNFLELRKAKKLMQDPRVSVPLAYFETIRNKPISSVIGLNWRDFPVSLNSEGLILVVDAGTNWHGELVTSETFDMEFCGSGSNGEFHLWNSKGVITKSPIKLNVKDHMDDRLAEAILDARPGGHCGCWVLVGRDGVVVAGKFFPLSKDITAWIVRAGLSLLNGGSSGYKPNEIEIVQRVEKLNI